MTVLRAARAEVSAHDHAVLVYDHEDGLATQLTQYLEDGLARREDTLFVHSFEPAQAQRFLSRVRPDWRSLQESGPLKVAHHRDVFEVGGRIDHDHVVRNVTALLADAEQRGQRGLRIFVDASRSYFDALPPRVKEWFEFESWLGPRLGPAAALVCAYRRSHALRSDLSGEVRRVHGFEYDAGPKA